MAGTLLSLFIGPPRNHADDLSAFARFFSSPGRKAVCGGTTAQIAARESGRTLSVPLSGGPNGHSGKCPNGMPPVGVIDGIDLVTEGIVTLNRAISILAGNGRPEDEQAEAGDNRTGDGGSMLAAELTNCEEVRLWVGRGSDNLMDPVLHDRGLLGKQEAVERLLTILRENKKRVSINWV